MRGSRPSVLVLVGALLAGCERYALDRQMEELCKVDGGVKVYETVALPSTLYDKYGVLIHGPWLRMPEDADFYRIGDDDYRVITKRTYMVGRNARPSEGEGQLVRVHVTVYRWRDRHLLGESISYWRGGGDGFTFGFQPSSNHCPQPLADVVQLVFAKEG